MMSIIAPDGWYDVAKRLPPGLNGALEPGGRENGNGIIPTNFQDRKSTRLNSSHW